MPDEKMCSSEASVIPACNDERCPSWETPHAHRTNEARRRVTIVNDARFAGYTGEEIGPGRVAIVVTVDPSDVVSETGSKADG